MMGTAETPSLVETRTASLDELREIAAAGRLYAILDACDAPAVPAKCAELGEERAVSLYRGSAEEMYWAIAPYLVIVDEALLEWMVAELWEEPWGIFAVADADLETLRRHFRRFLVVQAPNGEQWYFRYYDPRVLRTYLNTCTSAELADFFGPLLRFVFARGDNLVLADLASTVAHKPRVVIRRVPSSVRDTRSTPDDSSPGQT